MRHVRPINVAIVWPELANAGPTMFGYVVLIFCDRLAGTPKGFSLHARVQPTARCMRQLNESN